MYSKCIYIYIYIYIYILYIYICNVLNKFHLLFLYYSKLQFLVKQVILIISYIIYFNKFIYCSNTSECKLFFHVTQIREKSKSLKHAKTLRWQCMYENGSLETPIKWETYSKSTSKLMEQCLCYLNCLLRIGSKQYFCCWH